MAKINISIPDNLLADVDLLAEELGRSRSGFVQEATAHYVAGIVEHRAAEERIRRIDAAIASARQISQSIGRVDTVASVRHDRDRDDTGGAE